MANSITGRRANIADLSVIITYFCLAKSRKSFYLALQQSQFEASQKQLITSGVPESDTVQNKSQNRIQKAEESCRKSNGGPVANEEELDNMLLNLKSEKQKRAGLIAAIKYWKFSI